MKKGLFLLVAFIAFAFPTTSQAETEEQSNHTFTQPFQNMTTSLTGTAVKATAYFTKIDYWDVDKATFNLNYQINQLSSEEHSDLTVAVNGVKIFSWRPDSTNEKQQQTIDIPLELLSGSNTLTVEGQIINQDGTDSYKLVQTPANWLTIYDGSNVNFHYDLQLPENTVHSFYNHFIGADTIANQQSVILVPENATDTELSAASYALTGVARLITTSEQYLPLDTLANDQQTDKPYQLIIALYDHLPKTYQQMIDIQDNEAAIQLFNQEDQHVLVATAKTNDLLVSAGRYLANEELMTQTEKATKILTEDTDTFTSSLEFDGTVPLSSTGDQLTGSYHQEQVYFVDLPVDRNNVNGSSIDLHIKYADNLDFDTSLVTVSVNDIPIGSQQLTAAGANGDELQMKLPDNLEVADAFVVKVAFDLNVDNPEILHNGSTPWALIENTSSVFVQTEEVDDVLFANYPNIFIQNQTYDNLAILVPETLDSNYYKGLSNLLNLIGNYAQNNTGDITFFSQAPSEKQLADYNLIIMGTPEDQPLIQELNDQLYFQYATDFSTFVSNEKLSIESDYGKTIGTAQLLFSPYNQKAAALIVTGSTPETVYLATTQLKSQANNALYKGDTIVVDTNYRRYDYRFKKVASNTEKTSITSTILTQRNFVVYSIVFFLMVLTVVLVLYFIIKKYYPRSKGGNTDDK